MLKEDQKLNPKLFDGDVEQAPTRKGYGEGLLLAGEENEQVVALCCDLTESTQTHKFAEKFPHRFVEMGIQEQSMASVASGMAAMGKIPFIASYAMFSPGRNWEQIRTTICYNDRNVKIAGAHAGISVGPDGGTHQAIEDIAIMRVIPNMTVLYPCDAIEAKKATLAAARHKGPVYIRLAREKTPIITTHETPFEIGKAHVYWESQGKEIKVGIIATGPLLHKALSAARDLDDEGVGVRVLNLASIKPLPEEDILKFRDGLIGIVTLEEHQVRGGMGSAVSELLSQKNPLRMAFCGVPDRFGQSGTQDELIEHYGMGISSIKEKARSLL
jgi:transketolase